MAEELLVQGEVDLEREIVISHWDTMHQSEAEVGRISKRDLINKILEMEEDVLFIHDIF